MVKIKGSTIQITSEKDLQDLDSKMAQVQAQYVGFVVFTLTTLINVHIVDPIQAKMRSAGISSKIIDNTYLDVHAEQEGSVIVFHIKSDYVAESGFAVARMIEYGRRAFFVSPIASRQRPQFSKIKGVFTDPNLPEALSWIQDGVRRFSKGHNIPEYKARRYIEDGIIRGQPKIQRALDSATKKWISGILKA